MPAGTTAKPAGDGLPVFPIGTVLVKTFFYFNDKRDEAKGKRIIETRVLVKTTAGWLAGTYSWNAEQTDATLINSGAQKDIQWTGETGDSRHVAYRIPTVKQCAVCHNQGGSIVPAGFKIRNLDMEVTRQGQHLNQLLYLYQRSIIDSINITTVAALPRWNDTAYTLQQRARAYLDINCAHCHSNNGYCARSNFRAGFELSFDAANINQKKKKIRRLMERGRMPLLGTTMVHKEGLALIAAYLDSLE